MGGTSLDASLIVDGEPVLHRALSSSTCRSTPRRSFIHTIGAGGGSIAWLDGAKALQVGPQSAGADPGPASYARGGTVPTFTDAALAIGYLGTGTPLGGRLTLDEKPALGALEPLAAELGLTPLALARGIVRISTTKIMGAVRAITVEVGRDPKDFALLSFGGGGGLVAVDVAHELGIPTVIVPPGQGAFSAFGMLMADVQHDFSRTAIAPLSELDAALLEANYGPMADEAAEVLAADGFASNKQLLTRSVDVRYAGQEHTVTVTIPSDTDGVASAVEAEFTELHERQYGHVMDDPIEITTLRLRATGVVDKPKLPALAAREEAEGPEPDGYRAVYLSEAEPEARYALYTRESLLAGDEINGPAVIAEHTATTVIHAADTLRVGQHGEMVITVGTEGRA